MFFRSPKHTSTKKRKKKNNDKRDTKKKEDKKRKKKKKRRKKREKKRHVFYIGAIALVYYIYIISFGGKFCVLFALFVLFVDICFDEMRERW